jgi:hypothetical protein
MHALHITLIALWVGGFLILLVSNLCYWALMNMHRVKQPPMWEMQRMPDPADYTEIGRAYLRKRTRVAIAFFVWAAIGMMGLPYVFQ